MGAVERRTASFSHSGGRFLWMAFDLLREAERSQH